MAKFDPSKLYPNVSQSASAFVKKMLSSYPWARPTTRDCFSQAWLQDSYLMKLRRQTLTFTSGRLKEFLVEQQSRRTEDATKHKVMLRTYQSSPKSPGSGSTPHGPKWGDKETQNAHLSCICEPHLPWRWQNTFLEFMKCSHFPERTQDVLCLFFDCTISPSHCDFWNCTPVFTLDELCHPLCTISLEHVYHWRFSSLLSLNIVVNNSCECTMMI